MKDYLLAELERSLFDLKRIPKENSRGIRQAKAHIREVRRFDMENGNPFNDRYIVSKEEW